jgi:bifunctional ADP-heptose synthase (sugar kinase/adenylyltransferase)
MKRVLVLGDIIIDKYSYARRLGISAETPTVVGEFLREETFLGGAGCVARHLSRLGCEVIVPFFCTGEDDDLLDDMFKGAHWKPTDGGLKPWFLYVSDRSGWRATQKHRFFVDDYKMLQYDVLNKGQHTPETKHMLQKEIIESEPDAIVVSDYRHGMIDQDLADWIGCHCADNRIPLYVDSQVSQSESNIDWYGCCTMFMNERELKSAMQKMGSSCAMDLTDRLNIDIVLKKGARGCEFIGQPPCGADIVVPGIQVDVIDTCGAGDALLAAYVARDRDLDFANKWAALSTMYMGTFVPPLEDLERIK